MHLPMISYDLMHLLSISLHFLTVFLLPCLAVPPKRPTGAAIAALGLSSSVAPVPGQFSRWAGLVDLSA